jgi:signal transduction histidine kinase
MTHLSLRARLTILYGGLFLLAGAVSLVVLYLVVQHRLDEELGDDTNPRFAVLRQQAAASGNSTITTPDGSQVPLDQLLEQARADQEAIKEAALDALILQGGIAVLAVGLVAAGAGWIVAGRGLQPLNAITATARRIAGSRGVERDLSERIALTGRNDDIKSLADSFDAMLDNLSQAFDGQRRFVANASHELRTPLALERALIELESTKPAATSETVHFCQSLLAINDRHTRLIDGLLLLIDSQNEITDPERVDLGDIAEHVVAAARGSARELGIETDLKSEPAVVLGDPVMLEQLVRNLVENAIRHNHQGGWLRVETTAEAGHAMLIVCNSGDVLPEYEVPNLFEPFRRAGPPKGPGERGFGLGLSIVRAIVIAHSGQIGARPRAEGGLAVTARLPLAK